MLKVEIYTYTKAQKSRREKKKRNRKYLLTKMRGLDRELVNQMPYKLHS